MIKQFLLKQKHNNSLYPSKNTFTPSTLSHNEGENLFYFTSPYTPTTSKIAHTHSFPYFTPFTFYHAKTLSDQFACATTPPIEYGSSTAELSGGSEELPGFHPVISVLHRPHSTEQQTRTRSSQQAWKERTNHRARYKRSLSISGKRNNDPFPIFYPHFYKNLQRRNKYLTEEL